MWTGGVGVEAAEVDGVDEKYDEILGYELFITACFLGFFRQPGVKAFLAGLYLPGSSGVGDTRCLAVAEIAACRNNTCKESCHANVSKLLGTVRLMTLSVTTSGW